MRALLFGLAGGAAALVLAALARHSQSPARIDADGWKTLRPSWLLHGTFLGCAGFSALVASVLLSGGSTRADAETQNLAAFALVAGFGLCAAYVGWSAYGRTVAWRGDDIRVRTAFGREMRRRIPASCSITGGQMLGEYRVGFRDGSTLRFSAYLHGAEELAGRLRERARNV